MNPKILLAFVGGAAVAGALAVLLTRGGEAPKAAPAPSATQQQVAEVVERPVETTAMKPSDVAAGMEAVKPRPMETARREVKLPKPAPVEVKKGSVGAPVKPAAETASAPAPADSNSGVILPPFKSNPAPEAPKAKEEPQRAEILKPDTVAKPAPARVPETVTLPVGTSVTVRLN